MDIHLPAIDVINLSHAYNSHLAVDCISFQIPSGTTLGLIGPNGAGKSTTIKMLTTLLPVTSGTATIHGFDLIKEPAQIRQHIGYVPQLLSADGDLTGYENVLLSAKLYGLPRDQREKGIHEVLEFMDLTEFSNNLLQSYSGGMIRRLEIAQALVHKPAVLFLDEPSVGLDPAARQILWKHIEGLNEHLGTTILMTTHDMDEADRLCDVIALMYQGHILVMDSPQNLKAALGPAATLDDVFIHYTGSSLIQAGDYSHVKQIRTNISHL